MVEKPYIRPLVDIYQTPEGYALVADLPGVGKGGVELHVEENTLTLVGRKSERSTQGHLLHGESQDAHFKRVFELDPSIDVSKISAKLDEGVLTVALPKSDKVKPRKIEVGD